MRPMQSCVMNLIQFRWIQSCVQNGSATTRTRCDLCPYCSSNSKISSWRGRRSKKVSPKQFEVRATDLLDSSRHHQDQRESHEDSRNTRDLHGARRHARCVNECARRTRKTVMHMGTRRKHLNRIASTTAKRSCDWRVNRRF